MKDSPLLEDSSFDEFALDYDGALEQGLSASGESREYFCRGRISWLQKCLTRLAVRPKTALDFGCGTGSAARYFLDILEIESLLGIDSSLKSLERAQAEYGSEQVKFMPMNRYAPAQKLDLAFCNGVFHHIPPESRAGAVAWIHRSLRPGGFFAFWENNPWNPGTRYVMSRIPFDRDAITLSVFEARRLLLAGGFDILRINFLFVFPRVLKGLRFIEPFVSKLPFGAQYQILCRKAS